MKIIDINEPSTLNVITFYDKQVYMEVNTGNNRKPNFITSAGFKSWAKDQLERSPNSKLASVGVSNEFNFDVESIDLPLIDAHKERMRRIHLLDKNLVVNSVGHLQTSLKKLLDEAKKCDLV
ncbi:hypothetical protein GNP73_17375 [Aliivibrio fischeri]|uniref:hypothetical protein n=1 Tax=Aliivibrio fischeri TaxID=668 RepID=UPI0012DAB3CC|nr:hypothetical protein [Aliivibrio fischeri]MUJ29739.1 hypothetical protein [Aliivibrio fischeri]